MSTYSLTLRENLGRRLSVREMDNNFLYLSTIMSVGSSNTIELLTEDFQDTDINKLVMNLGNNIITPTFISQNTEYREGSFGAWAFEMPFIDIKQRIFDIDFSNCSQPTSGMEFSLSNLATGDNLINMLLEKMTFVDDVPGPGSPNDVLIGNNLEETVSNLLLVLQSKNNSSIVGLYINEQYKIRFDTYPTTSSYKEYADSDIQNSWAISEDTTWPNISLIEVQLENAMHLVSGSYVDYVDIHTQNNGQSFLLNYYIDYYYLNNYGQGEEKWNKLIPRNIGEQMNNFYNALNYALTGWLGVENVRIITSTYFDKELEKLKIEIQLTERDDFFNMYYYGYGYNNYGIVFSSTEEKITEIGTRINYVQFPILGKAIEKNGNLVKINTDSTFKIKCNSKIKIEEGELKERLLWPYNDGSVILIKDYPDLLNAEDVISRDTIKIMLEKLPIYEALTECDKGEETLVRLWTRNLDIETLGKMLEFYSSSGYITYGK